MKKQINKKQTKQEQFSAKGNMGKIYEIFHSASSNPINEEFKIFQIENYKFIKLILYLSYLFDILTKSFSCELNKKLDFFIAMMIIFAFFFILILASLFFAKRYQSKNRLDRVLGILAILTQVYFLAYCLVYLNDTFIETKLRGFFLMFIFSLCEILFSYEKNLLTNFIILFLNAAVSILFCCFALEKKNANPLYITYQIALLGNALLVMACVYKSKNSNFIEKSFKQNKQLQWSENYANDYFDNLNSYFFVIKNKKVKKINERFIDYLFSIFGIERTSKHNKFNLINNFDNNCYKNYIKIDNSNFNHEIKKEINNLTGNIDSDSDKRKKIVIEKIEVEKQVFLKNSSTIKTEIKNKITQNAEIIQEEQLYSLSKKFLKLLKPLKINSEIFAKSENEEKFNEENLSKNLFSYENSIKVNKYSSNVEIKLNSDFFSSNPEANLFTIVSNLKNNQPHEEDESNLSSRNSDFIYLGDFSKEKLDEVKDKSFFEFFNTKVINNFNKNDNNNNNNLSKDANLDINFNKNNYKKIEKANLLTENNANKEPQQQQKLFDEAEAKKNLFLDENEVLLCRKYFQVFVRVYTNISKTKESETSFDLMLYEITDLKQTQEIEFILKTKFFAKLAHEFKTPLNGILGLIKKIQYEYENEESKNSLKKIIKNDLFQIENLSNYVLFLINDIIEYSNIRNENHKTKSLYDPNSKKSCVAENNNKKNNLINNDNYNNSNVCLKINNENTTNKKNNNTINNNNDNNNFNSKSCELTTLDKNRSNNKNINNQKNSNFAVNINLESINLKEILKFCKDVTNTLIISRGKEKAIKTKVEFEYQISNLNILSDCFRVKQILLNFLSNAVKFTKKGEITIKAAIAAVCEANVKIAISVIDSGIGIKKDELELIFKDNTMLEGAKEFNFMGTGLGLSIARNIAAKLGHEIEVFSEYGKGTEFRLVMYCMQESKIEKSKFNFDTNSEAEENKINKTNKMNNNKINTNNFDAKKLLKKKNANNNNNKNDPCCQNTFNLHNKPFDKSDLLGTLNSHRSGENKELLANDFVNRSDANVYKRNLVFEDERNSSQEKQNKNDSNFNNNDNDNNNDNNIRMVLKEKDDILICNENIENEIIFKSNAIKESNNQNDLNKLIDEVPKECFSARIPRCFGESNNPHKFKFNKKFYKENLEYDFSSSGAEEELEQRGFYNKNNSNSSCSPNSIIPNIKKTFISNNSNNNKNDNHKISEFDNDLIYNKVYKNKSTNNINNNNNNNNNDNETFYKNSNNIKIINNSSSNPSCSNNRFLINDFSNSNSSFYKKSSETSSMQGDSEKTVVLDDSDIFRLDFENSKSLFEEMEKIRSSSNQNIFLSAVNNFNINCNNSENNDIKIKLKTNSQTNGSNKNSNKLINNCNNNYNKNIKKMDTGFSEQNTNSRTFHNYNSDNNSNSCCSRIKNSLKLDEEFHSEISNSSALQKLKSSQRAARKKLSKFSEKKPQPQPQKSHKNKILIADDQKFIRSALKFLVEKILKDAKKRDDFEILECCDGIDVLNEIIQDQSMNNTIKCVLTDENMEYINGSSTIKLLRKMQYSNKIKSLPIASLTAYEDSFNRDIIYKAGADLILSKPCNEKSVMKFFEDFKVL